MSSHDPIPAVGLPGDASPAPRQVRQGDVLLVPVADPGRTTTLRRRSRLVLALGEATGHAHAILEPHARELRTKAGERFVRLPVTASLVHEEHAPIELAPGLYRIVVQREYAPPRVGERGVPGSRRVAD